MSSDVRELCRTRSEISDPNPQRLSITRHSQEGYIVLECMEILSVATQKRINVYAVKGSWRLDQSIQSKIIAMAFSMAAELNAISFRNGPRRPCASRRPRA